MAQNIYDFFGLKPTFEVDLSQLESAYLITMKKVHPDLFASRPAAERRVAEQWSTRLNEAYQTIRDPVRRATWLCENAGYDVGAEKNTMMPMDFLLTQMRWREQLERVAGDAEAATALSAEVEREQASILRALTEAIDRDKNFPLAVELTRKLMFVTKFHVQMKQQQPQD